MPILSKGEIKNQKPIDNWDSPLEEHYFYHKIEYTNPKDYIKNIYWSIEGEIPKDISINNRGIIKGKISHFGLQIETQDNKPLERVNFGGSNSLNNGRYKHNEYSFNFIVKRKYQTISGVITEKSSVYIKVLKNFDIDNYIFLKMYLDKGIGVTDGKVSIKPHLNIGGHIYMDSKSVIQDSSMKFKEIDQI